MKKLIPLLLIPLLSFAQPDTLVLQRYTIDKVYEGLKKYEWYKKEYPERIKDINNLYSIINQQDTTLQGYISRTQQRDIELTKHYETLIKQSVEQERISNKGWSFWEWCIFIGSNIATGYVVHKLSK